MPPQCLRCSQNSIKTYQFDRFRECGPSKPPIFPVSLSRNEGYSQSKSGFKPGTSRFLCRNHYKTYAGMVYRASTCQTRFKSPKSFVTNSYVVSCRMELARFGSNPVYGIGGTSGSPDSALLHHSGAPRADNNRAENNPPLQLSNYKELLFVKSWHRLRTIIQTRR